MSLCKTEGGFDPCSGHGWKHLRDVTWQNMRRKAVSKRDAVRPTGSGGDGNFTVAEQLVFEIIGKTSPVLDGLPVQDSKVDYFQGQVPHGTQKLCEEVLSETSSTPTNRPNIVKEFVERKRKSVITEKAAKSDLKKAAYSYEETLKEKKLRLEVEVLEKKSRYYDLVNSKLDMEVRAMKLQSLDPVSPVGYLHEHDVVTYSQLPATPPPAAAAADHLPGFASAHGFGKINDRDDRYRL